MRSMLACAGINGDAAALDRLVETVRDRAPDAVLFAGGIAAADAPAKQKVAMVRRLFEALGKLRPPVAVIPGAHDTPFRDFLRAAITAETAHPNILVVHATPFTKGDLSVCGIGGHISESEDAVDSVLGYSHAAAEFFLRGFRSHDRPVSVLMFCDPPPGKLSGDGGNRIVQELIHSYRPVICITAGGRAQRGFEHVAHTLVVNPGPLSDGSAAWIDRTTSRVEMLDL